MSKHMLQPSSLSQPSPSPQPAAIQSPPGPSVTVVWFERPFSACYPSRVDFRPQLLRRWVALFIFVVLLWKTQAFLSNVMVLVGHLFWVDDGSPMVGLLVVRLRYDQGVLHWTLLDIKITDASSLSNPSSCPLTNPSGPVKKKKKLIVEIQQHYRQYLWFCLFCQQCIVPFFLMSNTPTRLKDAWVGDCKKSKPPFFLCLTCWIILRLQVQSHSQSLHPFTSNS